eukprot:3882146-Prorocentrum_lima.AAC.1
MEVAEDNRPWRIGCLQVESPGKGTDDAISSHMREQQGSQENTLRMLKDEYTGGTGNPKPV